MSSTIELTIQNMKLLSQVLEKKSIEDKFYNTDYGYYLEQMSFELHKHSAELQEIEYRYGGF